MWLATSGTVRHYPTYAANSRPQSEPSLHKTTDTTSITHCASDSQNEVHSNAEHRTTTHAVTCASIKKFCSPVKHFYFLKPHKSGCQMSSNHFTDMATIRKCCLFVAAWLGPSVLCKIVTPLLLREGCAKLSDLSQPPPLPQSEHSPTYLCVLRYSNDTSHTSYNFICASYMRRLFYRTLQYRCLLILFIGRRKRIQFSKRPIM
jgi:hypothetical protein